MEGEIIEPNNIVKLDNGDTLEFVDSLPISVYKDMRKKIRRLQMVMEKDTENAMVMELPEPVDYFERLCIRWVDSNGSEKPKTLKQLEQLKNINDYRKVEKHLEVLTSVEDSDLGKG